MTTIRVRDLTSGEIHELPADTETFHGVEGDSVCVVPGNGTAAVADLEPGEIRWVISSDPCDCDEANPEHRLAWASSLAVLSTAEIEAAIDELGETGGAKVERNDLYTRREENADWRFRGAVHVGEALTLIRERESR